MKIKMKTNMSGPEGSASIGDIITVDDKLAVKWVGFDYAEYAEPIPIESETAESRPVKETATIQRGKRRGKSKLANNNPAKR